MRLTQGTFSYLPDLSDEQIGKQISYALEHGWSIMVEYTDDPHPRNCYWDMFDQPLFDLEPEQVDVAMDRVHDCRKAHGECYIKVVAYDRSLGRQTTALSFIVNRPADEPGFRLERTEKADRQVTYTLHSYATDQPPGRRYGASTQ
jgi:ribulose-bisphosphate carboxylase small chain